MPYPKKDSDESTLPHPELNPLLNPLLAAHMGRWAEVYFTNPPDKREQAIADLLRELESNPGPEPPPIPAIPVRGTSVQDGDRGDNNQFIYDARPEDQAELEARESSSDFPPPVVPCSSCGVENWRGQRFCGMCGAPLLVPETHAPEAQSTEGTGSSLPSTGTSWSEQGISPRDASFEYADEAADTSDRARGGYEAPDDVWRPAEDLPAFAAEAAPVPYRYRAYIGVVLSILLVVLVYLAWHRGSAPSSSGSPQSLPLPAVPAEPPAATPPAGPHVTQSLPAMPTPAAPIAQNRLPKAKPQKPHAAAPRTTPPAPPPPTSSSTAAAQQSGNAELVTAEKYLNGTRGTSRDSNQAAQWLWKAVGKKNLAAALVLSDLYLRGDGVPKSCDQARLLLDAAARKGETAAAERLRNLQSFGCQ